VKYLCVDSKDPAGHFMRVEFRDQGETYVVYLGEQRAAVIGKDEYLRWEESDAEELKVHATGGYSIVWRKEGSEIVVQSVQSLIDFRAVRLALEVGRQ
jgi:hypothetical protein